MRSLIILLSAFFVVAVHCVEMCSDEPVAVQSASAPSTCALLDLTATTTQGFLPARMNTTQKNAINHTIAGLLVFDRTAQTLSVSDQTLSWTNFDQAAYFSTEVQEFNVSGTWIKRTNTSRIIGYEIYCVGGGGGGGKNLCVAVTVKANNAHVKGAGYNRFSAGLASGGGGGGAGGIGNLFLDTSVLDNIASVAVTVSTGGLGGTSGTAGSAAGNTSFGTYLICPGGQGGQSGFESTTPATGGSGVSNTQLRMPVFSSFASSGGNTNGTYTGGDVYANMPTAGGGGGWSNGSTVTGSGYRGGNALAFSGGAGGIGGSSTQNAGSAGVRYGQVGSGGGGASGALNANTGLDGGAGASAGGGGGGGGGAHSLTTAGNGGNGGRGFVRITTYYNL